MSISEDSQLLELDRHENTDDDEEGNCDGDAHYQFDSMSTPSVDRLLRSVGEVLSDRDAVDAFRRWANMDESRCGSAIDLHFTIKHFRSIVEKKTVEAPHLAITAHKSYISKKTGSCFFLPDVVRSEMSRRAHSIKNGSLSKDFFDIVIVPLDEYLKQLHANFISSEVFVALRKAIKEASEMSPSTSMGTPATIKKERASSLATSSPSTSSAPFKSSSPFPFPSRVAVTSAAISTALKNPFRTYNIDPVKQEPIDVDAAIASKQRHANDQLSFADKLGDKLQRLADEMEKRGVQFARDLSGRGDNFADLTEEEIDKDIDDYADRMDARGKNGTNKREDSDTPPATHTLASPAIVPPTTHYYGGMNGFAPPPSNRLRRKYMDTLHNTTAVSGHSSTSPTAGTTRKKGRPSTDHDSGSSGFYSGHPSSSSSAFSSHLSAVPHFNTLRRPTHGADIDHSFDSRVGHFPTLGRPSFVTDAPSSYSHPSPYFHLLTPNASPSQHDRTGGGIHNGFATLPRSTGRIPSAPGSSTSSGNGNCDGKILLRVTVTGNRPMVFRTEPDEGGLMTLKKFRTVFGLRREKNKFFFKNYSEDDTSDYQWDLVSDDSATVPLYHGSITAECRPALDSPE
ncbi:axl-1 [Pristionchus pacificus]|nr:axl-1 [Pristionchus pacificus]